MSASRPELPMAPSGCTLTDSGLAEQIGRYRQLGASAERITRNNHELLVSFGPSVDTDLLDQMLAIERECCGFFTLRYDTSERLLSITVEDPDRLDALGVLASALRGSASPSVALIEVPFDSHQRPDRLNDPERPRAGEKPVAARQRAADGEREHEPSVASLERIHEHHERDHARSEHRQHGRSIRHDASSAAGPLGATQAGRDGASSSPQLTGDGWKVVGYAEAVAGMVGLSMASLTPWRTSQTLTG
ncbi:MAG: hypothetical protein ACRDLT_11240 [Solirubrobacteraceae bacterium]